jgi:hypothetical protein
MTKLTHTFDFKIDKIYVEFDFKPISVNILVRGENMGVIEDSIGERRGYQYLLRMERKYTLQHELKEYGILALAMHAYRLKEQLREKIEPDKL